MALWEMFPDVNELRREIDRTLADFWTGQRPQAGRAAFLPGHGARQYPLVNVTEDNANVYVQALAPGVDPKTLDISVVHGTLTLKGEKPGLAQISAEAFHRNERAAGRFSRSIELSVEVEADKVRADYRNGLLLVTLPKSEAAKTRQISVNVA